MLVSRFYVDAKYTHLTEEKRAARYIPKDQIVECAFAFYLESHEQDLNVPVGKAVREWFGEDFGIGSELGHTVIHPRKTDVCAFCAKVDLDIRSVDMSIKRHAMQVYLCCLPGCRRFA